MADYVVIVAGGKGLRMGSDLPKQFLPIADRPLLMHTIERFYQWQNDVGIIVVLPEDQHDYWLSLVEKHSFEIPHRLAKGGATRFHSVRNGLREVPDTAEGCVAIHDGVRPFVSTEVISRCFDAARKHGAAIPTMPVIETLRLRNGHTVDRAEYETVQTPQVFQTAIIKKAYSADYDDRFTDDASVVENSGVTVCTVEGNRGNIKITTPFDIVIAEALVKR